MSGYTCVLDFRGETLTYYENGRHLEMQCTWTRGYRIYTSSISDWVYDDRSGKPVTTEERDEIIRRVVSYARREQGVVMEVSD